MERAFQMQEANNNPFYPNQDEELFENIKDLFNNESNP